ncbi:MAG: hypothetical protein OXH69_00690 [Acidobacteria bacterium]|nr:hypothetical protein [Acidobacteriota bacterium]
MHWLAGHSEWRLLVGVVPAVLAVLTVELLVGPEVVEFLVGRLVQGVEAQPRFARGMIMMSALTVGYVALCLALLAYYCGGVGASPLPADRKRRLAVAAVAAWIGFHAVLAGLGAVDLQLYSIAYDSVVRIYEQAGGPVAAAMTGDAWSLGVSRHLISILLPVAFGVAAVCAGSCHAAAIVEGARGRDDGERGQAARDAADRLVHSLVAMSALLVASTLLLTLYFRLPQALYAAGEAAPAGGAEYVDFANVVSIFWGIVMTLTLVAVYAPHAVALRSHAPVPLGELLQQGAETSALYSGAAKKAEVVVSALAPLLAALTTQLL